MQDCELAHSNIYPINELLEGMKGQVQNYRISMTQCNNKRPKRSP